MQGLLSGSVMLSFNHGGIMLEKLFETVFNDPTEQFYSKQQRFEAIINDSEFINQTDEFKSKVYFEVASCALAVAKRFGKSDKNLPAYGTHLSNFNRNLEKAWTIVQKINFQALSHKILMTSLTFHINETETALDSQLTSTAILKLKEVNKWVTRYSQLADSKPVELAQLYRRALGLQIRMLEKDIITLEKTDQFGSLIAKISEVIVHQQKVVELGRDYGKESGNEDILHLAELYVRLGKAQQKNNNKNARQSYAQALTLYRTIQTNGSPSKDLATSIALVNKLLGKSETKSNSAGKSYNSDLEGEKMIEKNISEKNKAIDMSIREALTVYLKQPDFKMLMITPYRADTSAALETKQLIDAYLQNQANGGSDSEHSIVNIMSDRVVVAGSYVDILANKFGMTINGHAKSNSNKSNTMTNGNVTNHQVETPHTSEGPVEKPIIQQTKHDSNKTTPKKFEDMSVQELSKTLMNREETRSNLKRKIAELNQDNEKKQKLIDTILTKQKRIQSLDEKLEHIHSQLKM